MAPVWSIKKNAAGLNSPPSGSSEQAARCSAVTAAAILASPASVHLGHLVTCLPSLLISKGAVYRGGRVAPEASPQALLERHTYMPSDLG